MHGTSSVSSQERRNQWHCFIIFPHHFALQCADVDHKWVTSGLLLQQESLQIRSNVKNLSYHKDKPVYSVKEQYYYSVDRAIYTVNIPLKCRRDCLYNKTKLRWVSIAQYLQRVLLCINLSVSGSMGVTNLGLSTSYLPLNFWLYFLETLSVLTLCADNYLTF